MLFRSITCDGVAATTITGLDHLEGETVKILADGAVVADKTVSSGSITLVAAASVVQVGLGYTHRGKTLKIEAARKSVVSGKSVSVRVDIGGSRVLKKKKKITRKH